jgi:3-oxoacyl-(acyl-carrier-protein) synthase
LPSFGKINAEVSKTIAAVAQQSLGSPALRLMEHFKIQGPRALITSSCSASLQALALGLMWIRSGKVRRCIVGATEIHSELTRVGFGSLRLLSKEICKPFDRNRTGINLGEGAAFLCLEAGDLRRENPWGYLTGAGLSTDAYHPTSPHPEGAGSVKALNAALRNGGLNAADIDWIYAHGTGSPANDSAEAQAIQQVFPHRPFVTSTKSSHGHALAASGVLESVLGLMAMKKNKILPTSHFQDPDPLIDLAILAKAKDHVVHHFVKNSLGFGGINASVIFSREGVGQ